jgi:FAD dependent monooxygenase
VKICEGVCIGHLWNAREVVSMTALEEGIFQTWHHNRIVLLGDSCHKACFYLSLHVSFV